MTSCSDLQNFWGQLINFLAAVHAVVWWSLMEEWNDGLGWMLHFVIYGTLIICRIICKILCGSMAQVNVYLLLIFSCYTMWKARYLNRRHIFNEGLTEVVISHLLSFVETKEEPFFSPRSGICSMHKARSLFLCLSVSNTHSFSFTHSRWTLIWLWLETELRREGGLGGLIFTAGEMGEVQSR